MAFGSPPEPTPAVPWETFISMITQDGVGVGVPSPLLDLRIVGGSIDDPSKDENK